MEWVSKEIVALLHYLLPGFFAAWIFYGLTAHPRLTPFERVVQALIFTAIVRVPILLFSWTVSAAGLAEFWSSDIEFVFAMFFAAILGHLLATFANNDGDGYQNRVPSWGFANSFICHASLVSRNARRCPPNGSLRSTVNGDGYAYI